MSPSFRMFLACLPGPAQGPGKHVLAAAARRPVIDGEVGAERCPPPPFRDVFAKDALARKQFELRRPR